MPTIVFVVNTSWTRFDHNVSYCAAAAPIFLWYILTCICLCSMFCYVYEQVRNMVEAKNFHSPNLFSRKSALLLNMFFWQTIVITIATVHTRYFSFSLSLALSYISSYRSVNQFVNLGMYLCQMSHIELSKALKPKLPHIALVYAVGWVSSARNIENLYNFIFQNWSKFHSFEQVGWWRLISILFLFILMFFSEIEKFFCKTLSFC